MEVFTLAVTNNLKQILSERGIKQIWLAEKCDMDQRTINNIVNNRYNTSLEVALKIADILSCKVDDIFKLIK